MKVAIIYSPQHRKLENAAKALGKAVESSGHRIEYIPIGPSDRPKSLRIFDFIYLGSIVEGTFGGKIPAEVSDYIKQCRGLENSKSAAFTMKRIFGNNKGLKRLMGILESMGSQVMDFQVIGGKADTEALGKRLQR
jgi:flavorubredoxin